MIQYSKKILKLHKIKPYTELEENLANSDKISIKTFFALCALENINILLISGRKYYELLCNDKNINLIHTNNKENWIELDNTRADFYRENYYKMLSFDTTLKSIGSYKTDELKELCQKLDIHLIDNKKYLKKDLYELLVQNF